MNASPNATLPRSPVDYSHVKALPDIWALAAEKFGSTVALHAPHQTPEVKLTYQQVHQAIQAFAAGLQALGVQPGERVALFADNSPQWFVADQGVMLAGGVNAVRSAQADRDELLFIYDNSGSAGLIVESIATLKRLLPAWGERSLGFIVLLSDEEMPEETPKEMLEALGGGDSGGPVKVLNYSRLLATGEAAQLNPTDRGGDAMATLIYTSGTSGRPKGVMLSHSNLLYQVNTVPSVVTPQRGERVLSILPSWHSYERTFEYFVLSQGCTQIYTSIRYIKQDFKRYSPQYMVGVPRIWESIYEGVQKQFREQPASKQRLVQFLLGASERYVKAKRVAAGLDLNHQSSSPLEKAQAALSAAALYPLHQLGNRLVYAKVREAVGGEVNYLISGGGSLAKHLDLFYEIVGVEVLQGYGLTETSPITNVRRPERNFRGTSGPPLNRTEIRIVDPQTRQLLPPGEQGIILIRGPQVMQGYYQNPEATAKAIDADGWFDSGDLGWVTAAGDLTITGRAKDTIVLTSGENIEPQPIEDACIRSPYIDQIMLVGQDQKVLGALIVPNLDALQQWASAEQKRLVVPEGCRLAGSDTLSAPASAGDGEESIELASEAVQSLLRQELNREVKDRPGYRPDDRIGPFEILIEPFTIENRMLTQTLKVRRPAVTDRYSGMINEMFG
ncbi:MAG: AMP-dependent synthetase/ligase [Elainellaceae cyanobacterium]